jgi:HEPN domain-containing protein
MAESCKEQYGYCKTTLRRNLPGRSLFPGAAGAEKAIKAVYISKKLVFPYIHDISQLLAALEKAGVIIPNNIKTASTLTLYAAQTRYPGLEGPVSDKEYHEALVLAESVVGWAEKTIETTSLKN